MCSIELPTTHADIFQDGRLLKVVTPTVEMSCALPSSYDVQQYGCKVRFLRLPVSCQLTPEDILHDALIGINTMLSTHTRRYLHRYADGGWQVRLGRTWMELYANEAADVCACLDVVGERYARAVREATQLETLGYLHAQAQDGTSIRLLWHQMRRSEHFIPYIEDIQRWLAAYPVPLLPATMLRPYYAAISAFIGSIEPSYDRYALHQAGNKKYEDDGIKFVPTGERADSFSMEELSTSIRRQVRIINGAAYEHRRCADLLSQIWLPFLADEGAPHDQELLDMMHNAIRPLWEQARFDMRYVINQVN